MADTARFIRLSTFLHKTLGGFADEKPDPLITKYRAGDKIAVIELEEGVTRPTIYNHLRRANEPLRRRA